MEEIVIYTQKFKTMFGVKLNRKPNESKKDFKKRCKENNREYKLYIKTRFEVKKQTLTQRMVKEEEHMVKRWDKRHPKPEPDLFNTCKAWEDTREKAIERIRDIVVSRYDKLQLIGRFKLRENEFIDRKIGELKDIRGQGHIVNELSPTAELIKLAAKMTALVHDKCPTLVCSTLKDHKRERGRIILPRAA